MSRYRLMVRGSDSSPVGTTARRVCRRADWMSPRHASYPVPMEREVLFSRPMDSGLVSGPQGV